MDWNTCSKIYQYSRSSDGPGLKYPLLPQGAPESCQHPTEIQVRYLKYGMKTQNEGEKKRGDFNILNRSKWIFPQMKLSMQGFFRKKNGVTGSCGRLYVWKTFVQPKLKYLEVRWETLNHSVRRKTFQTANEIWLSSWWNAWREVSPWAGDAGGRWGQGMTQI